MFSSLLHINFLPFHLLSSNTTFVFVVVLLPALASVLLLLISSSVHKSLSPPSLLHLNPINHLTFLITILMLSSANTLASDVFVLKSGQEKYVVEVHNNSSTTTAQQHNINISSISSNTGELKQLNIGPLLFSVFTPFLFTSPKPVRFVEDVFQLKAHECTIRKTVTTRC